MDLLKGVSALSKGVNTAVFALNEANNVAMDVDLLKHSFSSDQKEVEQSKSRINCRNKASLKKFKYTFFAIYLPMLIILICAVVPFRDKLVPLIVFCVIWIFGGAAYTKYLSVFKWSKIDAKLLAEDISDPKVCADIIN